MKAAFITITLLSACVIGACSGDKNKQTESTAPKKVNHIESKASVPIETAKKNVMKLKEKKSEGRKLVELAFDSIDEQKRGYLDMGQMANFAELVHVSMDYDDNQTVSLEEFMNWGYGLQNLAEDTNRVRAYNTALKVVYSFWDRNGDGKLTNEEHRKSTIADFVRADLDDNGALTKEEFRDGFSINLALKAALKD